MSRRTVIIGGRIAIVLLFFFGWESAARSHWISPFFISSPSVILVRVLEWFLSGEVYVHLWFTSVGTLAGFVIGTLLGLAVAVLFVFVRPLQIVFDPFLAILNSMPRAVLYPLFIIWFGLGLASKIALAVSLVFFVMFFNVHRGITEVDPDIVDNMRLHGATRSALVRHVYIPATLLWIFAGLRLGISLSLVGVVIGEFLGATRGIGWIVSYQLNMFRAREVMAGVVVLVIFVAFLDSILRFVQRRYSRWMDTVVS